jgi:hypothetical protein
VTSHLSTGSNKGRYVPQSSAPIPGSWLRRTVPGVLTIRNDQLKCTREIMDVTSSSLLSAFVETRSAGKETAPPGSRSSSFEFVGEYA